MGAQRKPADPDRARRVRAAPLLPATFPTGPAWYVVHTHRHGEFQASKDIEDLDLEVYMPEEVYLRTLAGKRTKEPASRPLIPQYLFVRFDLSRDAWGDILEINEVKSILGTAQMPYPIPDGFVDQFRRWEGFGKFDETKRLLDMEEGEPLEVLDGPFTDCIGEFERATAKDRGLMLIKMLGRWVRFKFSIENVRKV